MNLPRYAINHRAVVLAATLVLVALGVFVYQTAPRKEDPAFIVRDANLITVWPGATPQQVEQLVTDPLEKAIESVAAVRRVQSSSLRGLSLIQVTLIDEVVDAKIWWDKVRSEVELARPQLPIGASPPLLNDSLTRATVLNLSVFQDPGSVGPRYTPRELEDFAKRLRDDLMDLRATLPSDGGDRLKPDPMAPAFVERAELYGAQQEVIYVETEMGNWGQLALTPDQLGALLVQRNVVTPAGVIDTDSNRYFLNLTGQLDAVDEIRGVNVGRVGSSSGASKSNEVALAAARLARDGSGENRDRIGPISLPVSQAAPVTLEDLGLTVQRGYLDPPNSLTRYADTNNAAPCIVVSFNMKPGVNVDELDRGVERVIERAKSGYLPRDIRVVRTSDQPAAVKKKVAEVSANVVSSVAVVVVVLVFMAGVRISIIAGLAVPMIMLISIGLMRFFDVELEQVSLSALIVALGMLVDSTIQVCDNTQTHLNRGEPNDVAAINGTQEIAAPILIAALTVVASFLPMSFLLPGAMREVLVSLPVVVCLAMAVGWVFAVTTTAILAARFMRPAGGANWLSSLVKRVFRRRSPGASSAGGGLYQRMALASMRWRWPLVITAYAALCACPLIMPPLDFFPTAVRNQFVVELYLPAGSPIEKTEEVVQGIERALQKLDRWRRHDGEWVETPGDGRLKNVSSFIGTGGPYNFLGLFPKAGGSHFAVMWVNTETAEGVPGFVADLRKALDEGFGVEGEADYLPPVVGARVVPQRLVTGEPTFSPIDIRVLGPRLADERVLRQYADRVESVLRDSGLAWNIHNGWGERVQQIDIDIDQRKANLAGVTNATVAVSMNAFYTGYPLATYREDDRQVPVLMRLPPSQRESLTDLNNVYVQGYAGKLPLASIAEVKHSWQPSVIERYKRERNMAIRCRAADGFIYSQVLEAIGPELEAIEADMPPGYRLELGGTKEQADKGVRAVAGVFAFAFVLICLLLIIQFNSTVKTAMILQTLPLAVPGGLLGLKLMGLTLGFTCLVGFVALAGIVLSAAILLMDFSARLVEEKTSANDGVPGLGQRPFSGLTREAFREAIAEAGQRRFMPIMMTTLTTIGGLLSLMFAGGPLFEGLATVIVVGLTFGTALTLFVLPALIAIYVEDFGYDLRAAPAIDAE